MKNMYLSTVMVSSFFFFVASQSIQLKEHEQWWTNNLGAQIEIFQDWLGDENAASRVCARAHIKQRGYTSLLDIPCGLCTEYFGYKKDNSAIDYLGMDITEKLVIRARKLGVPAIQGSIENIPCADSSFDICYARHILEHLSGYKTALIELIRVAKKEVFVVFFMLPHADEEVINLTTCDGCRVYHNYYNKEQLGAFVQRNSKVKSIEWESVGDAECILHIYLN